MPCSPGFSFACPQVLQIAGCRTGVPSMSWQTWRNFFCHGKASCSARPPRAAGLCRVEQGPKGHKDETRGNDGYRSQQSPPELQTFIFWYPALHRGKRSPCPSHTSHFSSHLPAPFSLVLCKICELAYTIFNKLIIFHILKKKKRLKIQFTKCPVWFSHKVPAPAY